MRRDVALRLSFYYEVIILGYIYFCRVKKHPSIGYIGQDINSLTSLNRIRQHIDAAYSPSGQGDGCAEVIRARGCYSVEWAFFDHTQDYGLPQGVLADFKKHGTVNVGDLDLAEILHIVGSHMTNNVSSKYNKLIGGQLNTTLTYNWPPSDKYALALQQVFGKTKLPTITIVRGNPASSWQKAVYPGQYEVLKTFVDDYVSTKLKDNSFLNKLYTKISTNKYLRKIIRDYLDQYITYTTSDASVFTLQENSNTLSLWKQFQEDVAVDIGQSLGSEANIQSVIQTLKSYDININYSMFDGKQVAILIKKRIQEAILTQTRQQKFVSVFANCTGKNGTKANRKTAITNAIQIATHQLYNLNIPLHFELPKHALFYKKDISTSKTPMPLGATLLQQYRIQGGINSQQQNLIFQGSRYRIYRTIDTIVYANYRQVYLANTLNASLMARIHSASPFSSIYFEHGTEGIHEVLTAYSIDYKNHKGIPVEYKNNQIVRGGDSGAPDFVTRDDLINQGRPVLYSGAMTRLAHNPQDTKTYY